jgi:hypothetical protein
VDVLAATAITLQSGTLAHLLDAPLTARYIRITLTAATDGAIGWVYVGQGFMPYAVKHEDVVRRDYAMDRGSGLNSAARLLGKGLGGSIDWPDGTLEEAAVSGLVDMLDWLKGNGDEPLMYFPTVDRPAFSLLASVDSDQVELNEWLGYQSGASVERRYSARLGLAPVVQ